MEDKHPHPDHDRPVQGGRPLPAATAAWAHAHAHADGLHADHHDAAGHGAGHDHDHAAHGHAAHHHGPGGHSHVPTEIRHEGPLWWALALTSVVLLAEILGAWLTNSLALLSDAAHMATDTLALGIALVAVHLARRPPDARRTYGYARFEALGALANGVLLFVLAGYILFEAWQRFRDPLPVASMGMLAVALVGLVCNLVAMKLLHAGAGQSLNLKGAYLEVWSDMLGSVAVVVAALLIRLTGWLWLDPLLAVLLGLWVLPRTWILLREALNVVMEGVPAGMDIEALRADLLGHAGVGDVHDLHVWALASRTPAMTVHVVTRGPADPDALRRELAALLKERHGIAHLTLQIEGAGAGCGAGCEGAAPR
jgi:cobalt-zinc-cadmium efflux system protein